MPGRSITVEQLNAGKNAPNGIGIITVTGYRVLKAVNVLKPRLHEVLFEEDVELLIGSGIDVNIIPKK
jgi:hypothetical protein